MNRKIVSGATASGVFTAVTLGTAVVQLHLVLKYLPREFAGVWILFLTLSSYIAFFDLGISPTLGREIGFALGTESLSANERELRIANLLTSCAGLFRAVAVTVGVITLIAGEVFVLRYSHLTARREVALAWAVFSIGGSLNLLGSAPFAALFGTGDVAIEKLVRSASLILGLGATIGALWLGFGIVGLAVAWAAQGFLARCMAWVFLHHRRPQLRQLQRKSDWRIVKQLAAPSLKLATIQLGAILILQSANPLIALLLGSAVIPSYESLSKMAVATITLALLIVNASTPFMSMAYAGKDMETVRTLLFRSLRVSLAVTVILCSFIGVMADKIVGVWLGPGIFAGYGTTWILLIMVVLEVHHVVYANAVIAAGHIRFVRPALLAGALNIGLAFLFVPKLGVLGVALAVATAQMLTNNWYVPYVSRSYLHFSWQEVARTVWLPLSILAIVQVSFNLGIARSFGSNNGFLFLLVSFLLSSSVGVALTTRIMLSASDRMLIWKELARRFGPRPCAMVISAE